MKTLKKRVYGTNGYEHKIAFSDRTSFASGARNWLPRFYYDPGSFLYAAPEDHTFSTCLSYTRLYVQSKIMYADTFVDPAPYASLSYRRFWGRHRKRELDVTLPDVDWDTFYGLIAGCHQKKFVAPLVDWMTENFTHEPWSLLLSDDPDSFWSALTGLPLCPKTH